jgi:hypothetical protein
MRRGLQSHHRTHKNGCGTEIAMNMQRPLRTLRVYADRSFQIDIAICKHAYTARSARSNTQRTSSRREDARPRISREADRGKCGRTGSALCQRDSALGSVIAVNVDDEICILAREDIDRTTPALLKESNTWRWMVSERFGSLRAIFFMLGNSFP